MLGVFALWALMLVPLFFWGGCPCCGLSCGPCSNLADCWELVVAGVTDDDCTGCSTAEAFNGTFVLDFFQGGPSCVISDLTLVDGLQSGTPCTTVDGRWSLSYSSFDGWWELKWNTIKYRLDEEEFDCNGPNTFSFATTEGNTACTFPSTLTIEPC